MSVRINRVRRARIPRLQFDRTFWMEVAKVVEGTVLDNIRRQKQPDGSVIKRNAPSTRRRKRRLGRPQLSLVDAKHRLVQGQFGSYKPQFGTNEVSLVPASGTVRSLMQYTRQLGYHFYGLSKEGHAAIRALIRKEIVKAIRRVRR